MIEVSGSVWRRFSYDFTAKTSSAAGSAEAVLFFGDQNQTLELAELRLEPVCQLTMNLLRSIVFDTPRAGDMLQRMQAADGVCHLRVTTRGGGSAWEPQLRLTWNEVIHPGDFLQGSIRLRKDPDGAGGRGRLVFQRDGSRDGSYDPSLVHDLWPTDSWQDHPIAFRAPVGFNGSSGNPAQLALHFGLAAQSVDLADLRLVNVGQAQPDTPAHRVLAGFRRGVNLGNYLEYAECPPSRQLPLADFAAIRTEGFDHVRVPVAWHEGNGSAPDFAIAPCRWQEADRMITNALAVGLGVVVNLHHFTEFIAHPTGQRARFVAVWRQLAERYAALSTNVLFELLNEPFGLGGTDADLNAAYAEALAAIRETGGANATRLVLLSPAEPKRGANDPYVAHWERLGTLQFSADDPYVAATVHNYDPYLFTHQGTQKDALNPHGWSNPTETSTTGIVFPGPPVTPLAPHPQVTAAWARDWFTLYNHPQNTGLKNPASAQPLQRFADTVLAWALQSGRAAYVGEFGAFQAADPQSRINYARTAREIFESAGLSWAWWNWDSNFPYARRGTDRAGRTFVQPNPPGLRAALLPNSPLGTVVAPAIFSQPRSITTLVGQSVTFDVTAAGAPPLSYQWRRDGLLLAGATEATLTLLSVTAKDAGEYTVEVGDASGRVLSTAALLEVRVPPSIVSPPLARTLVKGSGQPLRLEVLASGTAPFSYQWLWNGVELTGFTSAVLGIASPEPFHSGSYAVRVSNAAGATTSAAAAVRVIESARLARGPASQAVFPGARVELSVEALGTGPFTYQWKQNGQNIPGATNATYVIESVGLADAGTYTVAVANEAGALLSDPAELFILLPPAPPGDNFAQRVALTLDAVGTITSTNTFATREADEPLHAGQPGARSVWFAWTAPATRQVTFNTIGSAFDTLLAVYTGTHLNALTELASDDDHGGFFTSEARFNAVAGTTYVIAVDGLGGENGRLVLSWSLRSAPLLPVITRQPANVTVLAGASVTLRVRADNAAVFQWRFNGANIPGATGADLALPNVTAAQVGAYDVLVSGGGATIRSREAVVEIGSDPNVRSYDKLEELLGLPVTAPALQAGGTRSTASPIVSTAAAALHNGTSVALSVTRDASFSSDSSGENYGTRWNAPLPAALGAPPALVVSAGLPRTQIIDNTTATTQQREANHCGVIGYHSRWLAVRPESGGTLVIHAPGATFPVVLALYTSGRLGDPAVACATGEPLRFPAAIAGRVYYLAVDGLNGVVGKIPIECRVGDAPPPPVAPPVRQTFTPGTRVTLNAPAIQVPDATYQWMHNGVPLPGGMGSEWELLVRTPQDAGVYSVVIDNGIGRVTNDVARVAVNAPLGLAGGEPGDAPRFENGQFRFGLRGNAGQFVTVEQSAGLTAWDEVAALWLSAEGRGEHRDTAAGGAVKFYRAREVPLRLESAGDVTKANALHRAARVRGGQLGRRYVLEQSLNGGATWQPLRTNTVQAANFQFEFPTTLNATHRLRVLEEE